MTECMGRESEEDVMINNRTGMSKTKIAESPGLVVETKTAEPLVLKRRPNLSKCCFKLVHTMRFRYVNLIALVQDDTDIQFYRCLDW